VSSFLTCGISIPLLVILEPGSVPAWPLDAIFGIIMRQRVWC
jgi:hypothetical protein